MAKTHEEKIAYALEVYNDQRLLEMAVNMLKEARDNYDVSFLQENLTMDVLQARVKQLIEDDGKYKRSF